MSYSRWSNGPWYAFYNTDDMFSLWYNLDYIQDWTYDECLQLVAQDIKNYYVCTDLEAEEGIEYVLKFIKDYKERNELSKKI